MINKSLVLVFSILTIMFSGFVIYQNQAQNSEIQPILGSSQINNQENQQPVLPSDTDAACVKEGERGSSGCGDVSCEQECCSGLIRITTAKYNPALGGNGCELGSGEATSQFLCTKCGNGACETSENQCNCPQDCQKAIDSIKIGKVELSDSKIAELESTQIGGHQPWRSDPKMVLEAEGLSYGFTYGELSIAKEILIAQSAGVATYEVSHGGKNYTVTIIRISPSSTVWTISEVQVK